LTWVHAVKPFFFRHISLLPQQQIDHETTSGMWPVVAAVVKDVVVVATSVLQRISKDRHPVKGTLLVDAFGYRNDIGGEPRRVNDKGTKGIAENISETVALRPELLRL